MEIALERDGNTNKLVNYESNLSNPLKSTKKYLVQTQPTEVSRQYIADLIVSLWCAIANELEQLATRII